MKNILIKILVLSTVSLSAIAQNNCQYYLTLPQDKLYKLAETSPSDLTKAFQHCLSSQYCSSSSDKNCMPKIMYLSILGNYYINKNQLKTLKTNQPSAFVQSNEASQQVAIMQSQQQSLSNNERPQLGRQIVPQGNQASLSFQPSSSSNAKYNNISFN